MPPAREGRAGEIGTRERPPRRRLWAAHRVAAGGAILVAVAASIALVRTSAGPIASPSTAEHAARGAPVPFPAPPWTVGDAAPSAAGVAAGHPAGGRGLRIVSLVPAASHLLVALGSTSVLVGRAADDRTAALVHLPIAGTVLAPTPEAIRALDPTVVLVAPEVDRARLASRLGPSIEVRTVRLARLADVPREALALGSLTARNAAAHQLLADLEAALAAVPALGPGCPKPSVVWAVGRTPPMVAGPGTLPDDLLTSAGAINAMADGAPWSRPSLEILASRPVDRVVWPVGGDLPPLDSLPAASPWRRIPAVREGRVIEFDVDLVHEAGPDIARGIRALAAAFAEACETRDSGGRPTPDDPFDPPSMESR